MKYYKQADNIECQLFDCESILLNIENGVYFRLNELGGFIWPLLDGKHSNPEIVASIVREFDVSAKAAREDLQSFMDELLEEKLIRVVTD